MSDNVSNTDTGGGSSIQGDANAGRDIVGRDQYNYYTLLPESKPEYSLSPVQPKEQRPTKEQLDSMYRQASTAHFAGNLLLAKEHYERVKRHDPNYPGITRALYMVHKELKKPYVDMGGMVRGDRIGGDKLAGDVIVANVGEYSQSVSVSKSLVQMCIEILSRNLLMSSVVIILVVVLIIIFVRLF